MLPNVSFLEASVAAGLGFALVFVHLWRRSRQKLQEDDPSQPRTMGSRVLIGGGSGFIGTALRKLLEHRGYQVTLISRTPGKNKITWDEVKKTGLPECYAVVGMQGSNILNIFRRWTDGFKKEVWDSRVETTKTLAQAISEASNPPKVWVSFSGVGYYKPSYVYDYDEDSPGGDFDYISQLATAWEEAAKLPAENTNTREVIIRSASTGVVLGRDGGAIKQMYFSFWFGSGGVIGDGMQFFPWIHINDLTRLVMHALENEKVTGVLNGVAPETITNWDFTKEFNTVLLRPGFFPLPRPIVNFALGEERAKMLTEGQAVVPKRTLESGFTFNFPKIKMAFDNMFSYRKWFFSY
ncbi:epimerase family protein SDR39U1-like isoform X1 [Branchiostoma floridae]|uniref:Epimerase family protein SDR39U1-like isoform X1 n=1 Tax=Branchiostoma floridae TaxID=7739 RepID=A0A9J7LCJ0_BRAFL|nr:epimerase family protein SDR39U1-like isoform X1 [Branchiostoma floridae]